MESIQVECIGGPHSGERVPDRGMIWRISARPAPPKPETAWRPPPAASPPGVSGTYVKMKGCYRWRAD